MAANVTRVDAPLEDFPGLFVMAGHAGLVGVLFATTWSAWVGFFLPTSLTSYWFFVMAVIVTFFVLSWASLLFANFFAGKVHELSAVPASANLSELRLRARKLILILGGSYVVAFSALIWLTGGISSPFIPLYMVIFVVTISRMSVPVGVLAVTAYFLFAILIACFSREISPWPFSQYDARRVDQSEFGSLIHLFFLCASFFAPVLSTYLIGLQNARRLLDDLN